MLMLLVKDYSFLNLEETSVLQHKCRNTTTQV